MISSNRLKKLGWLLVFLNILAMITAVIYFLFVLKFSFLAWLCYNSCFFSVLIFLIGFFLDKKVIMSISIPFLIFSGIGGLLVFSWSSKEMIVAQIIHILLILLFLYIILESIRGGEWKKLLVGFLIGLIFFFFLLPLQQTYINSHAELTAKFTDPSYQAVIRESREILKFFR